MPYGIVLVRVRNDNPAPAAYVHGDVEAARAEQGTVEREGAVRRRETMRLTVVFCGMPMPSSAAMQRRRRRGSTSCLQTGVCTTRLPQVKLIEIYKDLIRVICFGFQKSARYMLKGSEARSR